MTEDDADEGDGAPLSLVHPDGYEEATATDASTHAFVRCARPHCFNAINTATGLLAVAAAEGEGAAAAHTSTPIFTVIQPSWLEAGHADQHRGGTGNPRLAPRHEYICRDCLGELDPAAGAAGPPAAAAAGGGAARGAGGVRCRHRSSSKGCRKG